MESPLVPWDVEMSTQFEPYWFEKIDLYQVRLWVYHRRWATAIFISLAYLVFVWAAKQWMHFLPPLKLRKSLILWNGFLAAISIAGVVRGGPELYNIVTSPNGFHRTLCVREGLNQPAAFWGFMFMFSKFLHFGDTLFLVLRKKEVTFLHCYHHSLVFWATFYSFPDAEPIARVAAFLNYSVHVMMYSYYFLEGLNFRIPKPIKMVITASEILMFIIGIYINWYTTRVLLSGEPCARTWNSIALQVSAAASFLLLFTFFFYKNYLTRNQKSKLM